jgi:hypothetical protein
MVTWRDLGAGLGPLAAGVLLPLVPAFVLYGITATLAATTALALFKRTSVAKNDMAARRLAKINRLAGGPWEN